MKRLTIFLVAMLATGSLLADSLELADGRILEGDFIGSSNGIIMFDTGEGIEAFPEDEVVGLFFSAGVETAEELLETGGSNQVTVPSGTRLIIRMSDTLDSNRHSAGHRFRAQLDGAVVVDGVTAEYYRAQQAASSPWRRSNGVSEAPILTQAPSPIAVQANVLGDREDLLSTDAQRRNLKSRLAELAKLKERIQSGQYSMGDGEEAITAMQAQFTPPPEAIVGYTDENRYNASTEGLLTLPIGTIIPAVTVMKANSDRLGTFKAVVSQDVMDVNQTWVLIPKGSELIIKSFRMSGANEAINSVVGMSVPWIVLPDGNKIDTSKSSGLDREGMGGISDQVDHHWMEQFLGVAAYALVANNTSYEGTGNDSDSSYELEVAQGLRDQLAPHVQKYLQLRPTNVIRSGQSMNIIIEDEVFLKPWRNIYEDYL